jgi:nuclease S1
MFCRPRRRSFRAWFIAGLALLIVLQAASPTWAWGRLGHRVIAKLAERHLTDRAKAEIRALLEPGESLADSSTWADEVRGKMRHTAPWHYVDVPLDEPRYDDKFAGDDPNKGFIVPKIRELRATLKDKSKSVEERRFALRFLVHLVEDLHMPMHVGENHDKGGNTLQVRFFDRGSNLHVVWDTGIITRAENDEGRWLDILATMDTPEARQKAQCGTVEDWATESILASREAYKDPATGQRMKPGTKLGDAYQAKSLPVAKQRLYQAGTRLAMLLNELFPDGR